MDEDEVDVGTENFQSVEDYGFTVDDYGYE